MILAVLYKKEKGFDKREKWRGKRTEKDDKWEEK